MASAAAALGTRGRTHEERHPASEAEAVRDSKPRPRRLEPEAEAEAGRPEPEAEAEACQGPRRGKDSRL